MADQKNTMRDQKTAAPSATENKDQPARADNDHAKDAGDKSDTSQTRK